ncbi:MAG: RDD family protein [Planctomycetaceae bacterium]
MVTGDQKIDTRITVETPEGVDFRFMLAGPGKRCVSYAIDAVLKLAVMLVSLILVGVSTGLSGSRGDVTAGVMLVVWFAMSWLYGACCEGWLNGRTPGKISQGLRVVRTNGTPIGWFEAFGRNLLLVPDGFMVYGPLALNTVALISMASTLRMQRLGDLVFDTMVIDESREFISRAPGITLGIDALPRSECSGRYHVPERTLAVIERLFEGDRLISDGRREEIARSLSLALRRRLGYEEPAPDPTNPNTYFAQAPRKHTLFLRRVLKTFAEDGGGDSDDAPQTRTLRTARSPRKQREQRDRVSLDDLTRSDATPSMVAGDRSGSAESEWST